MTLSKMTRSPRNQMARALLALVMATSALRPSIALAQTAPATPSAVAPAPAVTPSVPLTPPVVPPAAPTLPAPASDAPSEAPTAQAPTTTPASTGRAPAAAVTLPRDLTPWGMFLAADIVVKAVMIGLAFASVLSLTIWFAKAIELMFARRRLRKAIDALAKVRTWDEATAAMQAQDGGVAFMVRQADARTAPIG